ncbi:MAG: hypothetical protein ABI672_02865 [Vicinamibacteria bacterium]
MRVCALAFSLLLLPGLAAAQDTGVALNMGRGLENGMGIGWTFKENWTLRPTLGAGYSAQAGFQASIGSTVLRSFGTGHRVYGYIGAGAYYGGANVGNGSTIGRGGQTPIGSSSNPANQSNQSNQINNLYQNVGNVFYVTAPAGVRVRVHGNVEAYAETAYQKALSGQFGLSQSGQFSNNGRDRVGATFGLSLRLN